MILIIGGAFQGKTEYALRLTDYKKLDFADGSVCDREDIFFAKGILHFHEYVRRILEAGGDGEELAEELIVRNPKLVIVTNELGYGVVPVNAKDRRWRETTGRICTRLAAYAKQVHRVACGIGMVIKDDRD